MQDNPFQQQHNPFESPLESGYAPAEQTSNVQYAGFLIRFAAYFLDAVILWVMGFIVGLTIGLLLAVSTGGEIHQGLAQAIGLVINLIYVLGFWITCSTTPGKMALNLRIVNSETGAAITPVQAILRLVGYFISTVVCLLGFIWIGIDRRKQGFHDMMAKTVVIKMTPGGARLLQ